MALVKSSLGLWTPGLLGCVDVESGVFKAFFNAVCSAAVMAVGGARDMTWFKRNLCISHIKHGENCKLTEQW